MAAITPQGQTSDVALTGPTGMGRGASYTKADIHVRDAEVPVVIAGVEAGKVSVGQILP